MNTITDETRPAADPFSAPFHRESYQRFLERDLPDLLRKALPLDACTVRRIGEYTAALTLIVAPRGSGSETAVVLEFADLPYPNENGVFSIGALRETPEGALRVVVPTASDEDLSVAAIRCVGEFLHDEISERLEHGAETSSAAVTPEALRAALPLDRWVIEFFQRAQRLDATNFLARRAHSRRIRVLGEITGFSPGQVGRACPYETPEGPNTGRILSLARGATIRDGRVVIVSDTPASALGLSASLIPFVSHSEPARVLMGANMMRQWQIPPDQEPPLVQTGLEPTSDAPAEHDLWCGRNLLTAFVSYGIGTHEDGLIVSASCAARLSFPAPLAPGDKLSNRHGSKGVIAAILPDAEMPHLPDGTPVEIVYSLMSMLSRMNHGQVLEAALGRVANAEGKPAFAPPFDSPSADAMRERMKAAGLPETGQDILREGRDGAPLDHPSTVGYVYWGRTAHDAADKVILGKAGTLGMRDYRVLRDVGAATHLLSDLFGGEAAAKRMEALRQRLAVAGIAVSNGADGLAFSWDDAPSDGAAIVLAEPIPHPWRRERAVTAIPAGSDLPGIEPVRQASERLRRIALSGAPASLGRDARVDLERSLAALFGDLLCDILRPDVKPSLSARTVAAPGPSLAIDQVGLPEPIVRALWPEATAAGDSALEAALASAVVLINRNYPIAFAACRPIRLPARENVIRIHPVLCTLLDSDFDGDQLLITLPTTAAAQQEAAALLSPAAHVTRNPEAVLSAGLHAGRFGIAYLSRTETGRASIVEALDGIADLPDGLWTKTTQLQVLEGVLQSSGPAATLALWDRLLRLGFVAAKRSGASLRPFVGETLTLPPKPDIDDPAVWKLYAAQIQEQLERHAIDGLFDDSDIGLPLLAAVCGARGRIRFVAMMIGAPGAQTDAGRNKVAMRHGWREGYAFNETLVNVAATRTYLRREMNDYPEPAGTTRETFTSRGDGVLARALRATAHPGVVFAAAAERGEIDPLTDPDSRVFVGLPPREA